MPTVLSTSKRYAVSSWPSCHVSPFDESKRFVLAITSLAGSRTDGGAKGGTLSAAVLTFHSLCP